MSPALRTILVLIATLSVGGWLLYGAASRWYFTPRAAQMTSIQASTSNIERYRVGERESVRIRNEIQVIVNHTLGGDYSAVHARLRARLNRLAEQVQLDPQSIASGTAGSPKPRESPARIARRDFRGPDFYELEGWVTGIGSLEQALTLVELIRAEPWIKRIDRLTLNPRENGSRFEINIRLTTLYLPQRWPDESAAATAASPDLTHVAALAQLNPFRLPPPAAAPATNQRAPSVTSPYGAWQLTGIARSAAGDEVWLLNVQTRESRRLAIGEELLDMTLTGTNGEAATFKLGEDHFLIVVGKNLGDRTPLHH